MPAASATLTTFREVLFVLGCMVTTGCVCFQTVPSPPHIGLGDCWVWPTVTLVGSLLEGDFFPKSLALAIW